MPFPRLSRTEWFVVALIVTVVVALVFPVPHWRRTSSQSCHLCGNCRVLIFNYRWWRLDSETVEPVIGAQFPVPANHTHDWWQYSATHTSLSGQGAADKAYRYRDGRLMWKP